jgi:hypothetical protein
MLHLYCMSQATTITLCHAVCCRLAIAAVVLQGYSGYECAAASNLSSFRLDARSCAHPHLRCATAASGSNLAQFVPVRGLVTTKMRFGLVGARSISGTLLLCYISHFLTYFSFFNTFFAHATSWLSGELSIPLVSTTLLQSTTPFVQLTILDTH